MQDLLAGCLRKTHSGRLSLVVRKILMQNGEDFDGFPHCYDGTLPYRRGGNSAGVPREWSKVKQ